MCASPPPSKPDPDAEREAHAARALARPPRKIGGLAEFSVIDDADIGREFPVELVAQPEPGIDVGEAGADEASRVRLAVEVELDLRLQHQLLREQKVVGGFQLGGQVAFAAGKPGDLKIEEVGSK